MPIFCCAAPMEGITGVVFRRAHARYFPGVDQYFTPFLSPTQDHRFTAREKREILPEHNEGLPVVPQLLTRNGDDFLWCARQLQAMGYRQVDLNLGCPSGTVVAKRKGAGLLGCPDLLEALLDQIFSADLSLNVSVKTRLGLTDPEEFHALLQLYQRYPISCITLHPRVRTDQYKGPVRLDAYAQALDGCTLPICYNGDLTAPEDVSALLEHFPKTAGVMIGRGMIADPALPARVKGGACGDKDRLAAFVEEIYLGYSRDFGSRHSAMQRMKELWSYLQYSFEDGASYWKKLRKTRDTQEYERLVSDLFRDLTLLPQAQLPWRGATRFRALS